MELLSRPEREAEPTVCAYGCQPQADGTVRVALLFVRAHTPATITLSDGDSRFTVNLPSDLAEQSEDLYEVNVTLEAP